MNDIERLLEADLAPVENERFVATKTLERQGRKSHYLGNQGSIRG